MRRIIIMRNIKISDITLRDNGKSGGYTLSFKEKIETAKILDKLCVDVIETPPIENGKIDILYLHSIAPIVKNSVVSCPCGMTEESVQTAYDAIKSAAKPRLHVMLPVSIVQMEYMCHKKPKAMLELANTLVSKACSLADDVEVSLLDSTRAEKTFLYDMAKTAVDCGAKTVTFCDSAGEMLPGEFKEFFDDMYENVPALRDVCVCAECSNSLRMAAACAVSCVASGVEQIKTTCASDEFVSLRSLAHIFFEKQDTLGIGTGVNMSVLDKSVNSIRLMANPQSGANSPFDSGTNAGASENIILGAEDDVSSVKRAVEKLGYELSDEDLKNVADEVLKVSRSKKVGAKELEAIIASVAMQVAPTYKLVSYVINNGNIITPTACIELERDGEILRGYCVGDGPIDSAFLAIEQITGHHFELDDFQIQAVTEGREAMGSSVVKLRHNGKPYSGKGISTDVIGASINAYISALNKICFEEAQV